MPAVGAHEVIIESARHVDRMSALSVAEFADVLAAYRERLAHWHDDGRFPIRLGLQESRTAAPGPLWPTSTASSSRCRRCRRRPRPSSNGPSSFSLEQGACPYCRLVDEERHARERVVLERDGLIAFCPFASLQPWRSLAHADDA